MIQGQHMQPKGIFGGELGKSQTTNTSDINLVATDFFRRLQWQTELETGEVYASGFTLL